MNQEQQRLLIEILDLFAQRFDKHAVLRGGMVLYLLGSERLTNDLDYVFVPYRSKKDIVDDVLAELTTLPGVAVKHSMNSKCLRIIVQRGDTAVQVEAKTAEQVHADVISTAPIAQNYNLPPRLIRIVNLSVALSDKLAAWNERRLVRDLYDIWFFLRMGVQPDAHVLQERLAKPNYSKLVKPRDHFKGQTTAEFFDFIREQVNILTEERITAELQDYLPAETLVGMHLRIRAELAKLHDLNLF
ncbi:MAG: hypothetical protein EOL87_17775 [Spartobacteria bacterium]|nr:hypothetical protein [Spartobacteria bacterium]